MSILELSCDGLLLFSYLVIPIQLLYFKYNYPNKFPPQFGPPLILFVAFITLGGLTHLLHATTFSDTMVSIWRKPISALTSIITVVAMVRIVGQALKSITLLLELESDDRIRLIELNQAAAQAKLAILNQSQFISFIAHELRNAMQVVTANTEFLFETKLDANQNEYVRSIDDAGLLMVNVMNDVLDISKLQAGKMTCERLPLDLLFICRSMCKTIETKAAVKKLQLILDFDPTTPQYVISDPTRIRQILLNLLSNALKFTTTGSITLKLTAQSDEPFWHSRLSDSLGTHSSLTVLDRERTSLLGCGQSIIENNHVISLLSHPFFITKPGFQLPEFQSLADSASEESVLVQPKQLNQTMLHRSSDFDASISPRAIVKQWVIFQVTDTGCGISSEALPSLFEPFVQEKLSTVRLHGGSGLGLAICASLVKNMKGSMVVESIVGQGSTFSFALHLTLSTISEVATIHAHLDHQEHQNYVKPISINSAATELIATDIQAVKASVHGIIGIDSPTICESDNETDSESPTISNVIKNNIFDSPLPLRVACRSVLLPLDLIRKCSSSDLIHNIQRPTTRILVVDDNAVNVRILVRIISQFGYALTSASDGLQALNIVKNNNPGHFALIFMDLQMPTMGGIEAARHIRAAGYLTPIVALTANTVESERNAALSAGCNIFQSKPIRRQQIYDILTQFGISPEKVTPRTESQHPTPESIRNDVSQTPQSVETGLAHFKEH